MRIWLITVGEPLPLDGKNERLLRTGLLADALKARGHEIVWWTSSFDHVRKKQRCSRNEVIDLDARYRLVLLYGPAYQTNISLQRVRNHRTVAAQFRQLAPVHPRPDIILCSLPTLELSSEATCFGMEQGIPVVLDIRDLWPDVYLDILPAWSQPLGRLLLFPQYRNVRRACRNARALVGLTPEFVDWGVAHAGRERSLFDKDFPLGYSSDTPQQDDVAAAEKRWNELGIKKEMLNICFFGTLGRQFDIDTVIAAASILDQRKVAAKFILCGSGDRLEDFKRRSGALPNILYPGWIDKAAIWTLMRLSSLGLAPYRNVLNFTLNLPNKPIEYLSAGLPILTCLQGTLAGILKRHDCGIVYQEGNAVHLAEIIADLGHRPEQLNRMSVNARLTFEKQYTAEKVYGEMIDHLEKIAFQ